MSVRQYIAILFVTLLLCQPVAAQQRGHEPSADDLFFARMTSMPVVGGWGAGVSSRSRALASCLELAGATVARDDGVKFEKYVYNNCGFAIVAGGKLGKQEPGKPCQARSVFNEQLIEPGGNITLDAAWQGFPCFAKIDRLAVAGTLRPVVDDSQGTLVKTVLQAPFLLSKGSGKLMYPAKFEAGPACQTLVAARADYRSPPMEMNIDWSKVKSIRFIDYRSDVGKRALAIYQTDYYTRVIAAELAALRKIAPIAEAMALRCGSSR